ncbi:unnamed protein product, partial [Rotaria sp. Silwood1]
MKIILTVIVLISITQSSAQISINWKGYQWYLREQQNSGPGPNNWSSSNVWVDANDRLHLKLSYSSSNGGWTCAELYSQTSFTYGTFKWHVEAAIDNFDPNVVLGLFTYGLPDGANEIDIEVAKWGQTSSNANNFFYTVYPRSLGGHAQVSSGTKISLQGTYTTHRFTWSTNQVNLQ